jgi:outer membrane biosynthesis protein TonB
MTFLISVVLPAWPQQKPDVVSSPRSQETDDPIIVREIKTRVEPKYPELARQFNIHGKVRIEATVSPNGNLKKTREIGGSP